MPQGPSGPCSFSGGLVQPQLLALGIALPLAAGAAQARTQRWKYKSHLKDPASGRYDKDNFRVSTVEVEEQEGKAEPFRRIIRNDGSSGPRLQQRNER